MTSKCAKMVYTGAGLSIFVFLLLMCCSRTSAAPILVVVATNGSDITINLPAENSNNRLFNWISDSGNNNPSIVDWIGGNGANKAPRLSIGGGNQGLHGVGGQPGKDVGSARSLIETLLKDAADGKGTEDADDGDDSDETTEEKELFGKDGSNEPPEVKQKDDVLSVVSTRAATKSYAEIWRQTHTTPPTPIR
ncbi:uncharacterized protein LOC129749947 [Uranotaenia lowii]|uniref:uncharacterized protein LOC129749947 n=1 Tax=Uranotaenia lowii TaxID=190385 RepID=UPI002478E909|nr:uncharacterized protein LOC129749947 [Uranotaenia lowii]